MAEEEELGKLVFNLISNVEQMQKQLESINDSAKKTSKSVSAIGVASRKAFLNMINSSVIAGTVMQDFNDIVGILADEIFVVLLPAIEPIIEFMYEMVDAFIALDDNHKIVVAAITAVAVAMYLISAHPIIGTIAVIAGLLILAEQRFGALTKAGEFLANNWERILFIALPFVGILVVLERKFGLVSAIAEHLIDVFNFFSPVLKGGVILYLNIVIKVLGIVINLFKALDHILFGGSVIPHLEMMGNIINTLLLPSLTTLEFHLKGIQLIFEKIDDLVSSISGGFGDVKEITNNITQFNQFIGGGPAAPLIGGGTPAGMITGQLKSLIGF